jgi:NAD(P)-dependent dehydrogenase (short-subunit alcohol dehydrogenase family)
MLSEKVIVVTGGGGLLGRGFCSAIAKQGALTIIADQSLSSAEQVAEEINLAGGRAEATFLDVTGTESVESLIDRLDTSYGRINAMVNNAYPRNKNWGKKLEEVTYADFCENTSLHLGGYFLTTQKFSMYMSGHGGGSIVNMSSIYGSIAPKFEIYDGTTMTMPVEYAAIKAGINHLTCYFAQYFKKSGVRCNSLSPGGIFNNQPKSFLSGYTNHCGTKGMLDPQDIAGTLLFLLSDESKYITGQNFVVDDGFSL